MRDMRIALSNGYEMKISENQRNPDCRRSRERRRMYCI